MAVSRPHPDFDSIARPYRWLEYLTLGRSLQRCRLYFLPGLSGSKRALVLGDGDGRFLARLLTQNPDLSADAVDLSATMLGLLRSRCMREAANAEGRLQTHQVDAIAFAQNLRPSPELRPKYDLIVSHFFLDCLTQHDVDTLVAALAPYLSPNALWLVSDFGIPHRLLRLPARVIVRALYLAFRVLTGLKTSRLPDHAAALTRAGFIRIAHRNSLLGLLFTELWNYPAATSPFR